MAFYLKKLTPKQREQFAQKQIENPLSPALGVLHPIKCITDTESDVVFVAIGTHRDYPDEELFFLHWRAWEMILPLRKENRLPNTRIWSLNTSWENPIQSMPDEIRPQIMADLKEILAVYRVDGTRNPDNLSVEIFYDF